MKQTPFITPVPESEAGDNTGTSGADGAVVSITRALESNTLDPTAVPSVSVSV